MESDLSLEKYEQFLRELKERIRNAQIRAALAVNRELILLYWQIGREILTRQQQEGWGAKVILHNRFPEIDFIQQFQQLDRLIQLHRDY